MKPIITKRHPIKFYFLVAFTFLLFCFMGTRIMVDFIDLLQKGKTNTMIYLLPVFSLGLYFTAGLVVHSYWKKAPTITVDNNTIQFGPNIYYFKDIKDISLTGKKPFRLIINHPIEGTSILFNDGTEKFFFDDMYANSWEIKSFLEQTVVNKQEYRPTLPNNINKNSIRFETEETFKGNQFTSFMGILLWGSIGFLVYLLFSMLHHPSIGEALLWSALGLFLFVTISWSMNYFGLTEDYLIVRNHNFTWRTKIYPLADIKEVVFESPVRQENTLRVITKNFRSNIYPAGTLRDKTWLDLKNKLEMKGVVVRNEWV